MQESICLEACTEFHLSHILCWPNVKVHCITSVNICLEACTALHLNHILSVCPMSRSIISELCQQNSVLQLLWKPLKLSLQTLNTNVLKTSLVGGPLKSWRTDLLVEESGASPTPTRLFLAWRTMWHTCKSLQGFFIFFFNFCKLN